MGTLKNNPKKKKENVLNQNIKNTKYTLDMRAVLSGLGLTYYAQDLVLTQVPHMHKWVRIKTLTYATKAIHHKKFRAGNACITEEEKSLIIDLSDCCKELEMEEKFKARLGIKKETNRSRNEWNRNWMGREKSKTMETKKNEPLKGQ